MASELDFGNLQSRLSTFLLLFGVPHVDDMSQIALISPKERRTETTTRLNDVRRRRRRNGVKRDKGYQVAVPKLATMGDMEGRGHSRRAKLFRHTPAKYPQKSH